MKPIAVAGLGLMGGSVLRGLSAAGRAAVAWGPDPGERAAAAGLPGVRVTETFAEALAGADGVVLAAPLSAVDGLLDEVARAPHPPWVTDLVSLQAPPLAAASVRGLTDVYVTSHPMAGGHRSGFEASKEGLFAEAPVWLSAGAEAREAAAGEAVSAFWRFLGARPAWCEAREHDRRMAWVSHLPQVVSTHLASVIAGSGIPRSDLGPGGRDVTRLAGSDPRMWRDLLGDGSSPLPAALRTLAAALAAEADRLEAGDTEGFAAALSGTRDWSLR